MPVLKVSITALSPLVFSERRPDGQFRQSAPYVPGAVLRGALAQQMLNEGGRGNSDFTTLFTAPDAPLFRHAYPACFWREESGDLYTPSRHLPATAYSCKPESGFDKHGVFDGLIDRLCCEELGVRMPYFPRCLHPDHRGETELVEDFGGFYSSHSGEKKSVEVPSQLTTRVALDRRRKVAEEGLLYSPMVIRESRKEKGGDGVEREVETCFFGSVVAADDEQARLVKHHLEALTNVGSGAARGFGRVEARVEDAEAEDPAARVVPLNESIKRRWEQWQRLRHDSDPKRTPENGTFFVVLLLSDAVLRAEDWAPTVRLEAAMLGTAGAGATLLRCYATADYRGGWNTGWRLPKDTELVARRGSVYVYHVPKEAKTEGWPDALRALEERGVGERRAEGSGQVRVCEEFHQEIQEVTTA